MVMLNYVFFPKKVAYLEMVISFNHQTQNCDSLFASKVYFTDFVDQNSLKTSKRKRNSSWIFSVTFLGIIAAIVAVALSCVAFMVSFVSNKWSLKNVHTMQFLWCSCFLWSTGCAISLYKFYISGLHHDQAG